MLPGIHGQAREGTPLRPSFETKHFMLDMTLEGLHSGLKIEIMTGLTVVQRLGWHG